MARLEVRPHIDDILLPHSVPIKFDNRLRRKLSCVEYYDVDGDDFVG
ncbi:hypothetical protein PENARI_c014G02278 [Penicillium arizonense]|uniref:Uncharacterized protein n=1 Tax=Penicillium arizonense TaxID=1835702 RepID=A0A1F5LCX5_PENAI|nr:hypothetical protein PENARI_c014G02278 [Penicillium arizonense]OGE51058.1 hypothetical protein PENARI_c014G02278 [Penicillium arizonense]